MYFHGFSQTRQLEHTREQRQPDKRGRRVHQLPEDRARRRHQHGTAAALVHPRVHLPLDRPSLPVQDVDQQGQEEAERVPGRPGPAAHRVQAEVLVHGQLLQERLQGPGRQREHPREVPLRRERDLPVDVHRQLRLLQ